MCTVLCRGLNVVNFTVTDLRRGSSRFPLRFTGTSSLGGTLSMGKEFFPPPKYSVDFFKKNLFFFPGSRGKGNCDGGLLCHPDPRYQRFYFETSFLVPGPPGPDGILVIKPQYISESVRLGGKWWTLYGSMKPTSRDHEGPL